jgi:hypothetical protein
MSLRVRAFPIRVPGAAPLSGSALPLLVGAAGILASAAPASAQTAQEILARAMAQHEHRLEGVENLTLRQEVMGIPTTTYLVKETVDGHAILRPEAVDAIGVDMDLGEEPWDLWADPRAMYGEWADRWDLEGEGSVDGSATWRMVLTDFEGIDLDDDPVPGGEGTFEARRMVLEMETDRLVPLRMVMEGEVVEGGEGRPVAVAMRFSDYRTVDGYLHPFRIVMEMDVASADISPEEIQEAREALEEFRRELDEVPEAQRDMLEQMMGEQLQMLERMVAGEGLEVEIRVTDLRVNEGPPDS